MLLVDPKEFRLEIYVDDPWMAARGSRARISRLFAVAALWLEVLGFPLAWKKAAAGDAVQWVGATVEIRMELGDVSVSIPEKKRLEAANATAHIDGEAGSARPPGAVVRGVHQLLAGMIPELLHLLSHMGGHGGQAGGGE